jgi:galactokinase
MIDVGDFRNEFQRRYGARALIVSAPGRVNLIGEHTDYNEGFVMPFAIDRSTLVGVSPRSDDLLNAHTLTLDKTAQIKAGDKQKGKAARWTKYIAGMAEMLKRCGLAVGGADILIDSDIPFGAGLSSSAALEMGVGAALAALSGQIIDPREIAFAGQKVEHEFVGVRSGIMDQFASGLSRKGNALLIDCRSLELEYVPLELGTAILVACDTHVKHSLASSEYNRRREECERAVEILSSKLPRITALRDVTLDEVEKHKDLLPDSIFRRCRHVVSENARTLKAAEALQSGDLKETGRLMNLSHESLRDDYEVSCTELDLLQRTAVDMPEVYGSRMTGGGFGGCTINLLESSAFEDFKRRVVERYEKNFNREPTVFQVKPSAGAHKIDL